jgi:hypothetical protein
MVQGGHVATIDCTLTTDDHFLGVVMKDGFNGVKGSITLQNCTLRDNMWGASFGTDVSEAACKAVLAANTFIDNDQEDITRMYEQTGHSIQPWRRSWATDT